MRHSCCAALLDFFLFSVLLDHFSMCFFYCFIRKKLVSINNVIKYNEIYDLYFEIRYLHPYLSISFPIYSLIFTWFSYKMTVFLSIIYNLA